MSEAEKTLYARCKSIPWPKLASEQWKASGAFDGPPISQLPSFNILVQTPCRMCKFLPSFAPPVLDQDPVRLSFDFAYTVLTGRMLPDEVNVQHSTVVTVWADQHHHSQAHYSTLGFIHPNSECEDFKPRKIVSESIDWRMVRSWLDTCRDQHSIDCSECVGRNLLGFEVIDCNVGHTVSAPEGCVYVALSYVWGSSASDEDEI